MSYETHAHSELDHLQRQVRALQLVLVHLLADGHSASRLLDYSLEIEDRIESVDEESLEGNEAFVQGMCDTLIFVDGRIANLRFSSFGPEVSTP